VIRFLLAYLFIYGGVHYYLFRKLTRAFPLRPGYSLLPALGLALLFLAPLASRRLDDLVPAAAELLALTGYWWMGLLFLYFSAALLLDLATLLARSGLYVAGIRLLPLLSPRATLVIASCYAALAAGYAWFAALDVRTERVVLTDPFSPAATPPLRIVQVSDLHVGQIVNGRRLERLLAAAAAAKPDLLVATGDLVDGHQRHLQGADAILQQLAPPLGKIAILGNHEHYVGVERSRSFLEAAGFRVLQDQQYAPTPHLTLIGCDDRHARASQIAEQVVEDRLLRSAPTDRFVIVLKHRPLAAGSDRDRFDLQLSGHVHGGQIFPFVLLTRLSFPVPSGLSRLSDRSSLYLSRGTGTWGPPLRLLAHPEVTIIDIVPAAAGGLPK
jgi:predicted MPP superfamily phosphohydrolase